MLARAIFPDESGMLMEAMFGEVETLAYVIDSECRLALLSGLARRARLLSGLPADA